MNYRNLGSTDLTVSPLCLGTMMFGAWGNTDHEECVRIIHQAIDSGINFIDTANMYSDGECEEIVGKALAGRRDEVVLATKVFFPMGPGPDDRGLSRAAILKQVERMHGWWPLVAPASSASEPTPSTSTRSTDTICRSPGKRLWRLSPTSCGRERSGT